MGNLNLNLNINKEMGDAAWTWTEPKDKACWSGLATFTAAECKEAAAAADGAKESAAGKVGDLTLLGNYVVACTKDEIHLFKGTAGAKPAEPTDAEVKTAKDASAADGAALIKVKLATQVKGKVPCIAWGTGSWATFTAAGFADPAAAKTDANATGAKTLAAAFTAGALAVAATQF